MHDTTRGAIFDLDGTLIDTYDAHHAAWRSACAANGIELTTGMFAWSFGRTNPSIIRRFWADAGRPVPTDAEIDPYWRRLIEHNRDRLIDPANPDLIHPGQVFETPTP